MNPLLAILRMLPRPVRNVLIDLRDPIAASLYSRKPSLPPPHAIKVRAVLNSARRHNIHVLVETGTCLGEMVRKCRRRFQRIYTIELSEQLAAEAAKRLANYSHVEVLQGDSADLLPQVVAQLNEPAVFWLDAHYSGGMTAKGVTECPLERELRAIALGGRRHHVILIDDARLMGQGDFPSLEKITELARSINPDYRIEVRDDIIRCEPPSNPSGCGGTRKAWCGRSAK